MNDWEPKSGDRVKHNGHWASFQYLLELLEDDKIYTIDVVTHSFMGDGRIRFSLKEIDTSGYDCPYFRKNDFVLVEEGDTAEKAWNRAMGLL